MRILLTNDDGVGAAGLIAMYRELASLGEVTVVAPASCQSAVSHAITIPAPVTVSRVRVDGLFDGYSVDGRPADCVKIALHALLESRPDLIVSGINDGANVSINVLYSGTVAGAAEGALAGIPAVAVSLERDATGSPCGTPDRFERAAAIARSLIQRLLEQDGAFVSNGRPAPLLNVNIPALRPGVPKGVRVVRQSTQLMLDSYAREELADGRWSFRLEGRFADHNEEPATDLGSLRAGYVAITPLTLDRTHDGLLRRLAGVDFGNRGA